MRGSRTCSPTERVTGRPDRRSSAASCTPVADAPTTSTPPSGSLAGITVVERRQLLDLAPAPQPLSRGTDGRLQAPLAMTTARQRDLAAARRHLVPVVGTAHRRDVRAGPDGARASRGEALDELGHLRRRHVAVGVRALVAKARQAAEPVGREQPQRIPALAPPGVRHLAALQHDVVDRTAAQEVARGEARVSRADDDRGDALDGECLTSERGSGDFDGDVGRVRQSVEHGGALLGLGHQRLDVLLRRVGVDVERRP